MRQQVQKVYRSLTFVAGFSIAAFVLSASLTIIYYLRLSSGRWLSLSWADQCPTSHPAIYLSHMWATQWITLLGAGLACLASFVLMQLAIRGIWNLQRYLPTHVARIRTAISLTLIVAILFAILCLMHLAKTYNSISRLADNYQRHSEYKRCISGQQYNNLTANIGYFIAFLTLASVLVAILIIIACFIPREIPDEPVKAYRSPMQEEPSMEGLYAKEKDKTPNQLVLIPQKPTPNYVERGMVTDALEQKVQTKIERVQVIKEVRQKKPPCREFGVVTEGVKRKSLGIDVRVEMKSTGVGDELAVEPVFEQEQILQYTVEESFRTETEEEQPKLHQKPKIEIHQPATPPHNQARPVSSSQISNSRSHEVDYYVHNDPGYYYYKSPNSASSRSQYCFPNLPKIEPHTPSKASSINHEGIERLDLIDSRRRLMQEEEDVIFRSQKKKRGRTQSVSVQAKDMPPKLPKFQRD